MKKYLLVLTFIVLSGCANTGEKFSISNLVSVPENQVLIYFYRINMFYGGGIGFNIIANNVEIGTIYNNTYFRIVLPSDSYEVHSTVANAANKLSIFTFLPGKTYFVKSSIVPGWTSSIKFTLVPKIKAMIEMSETRVLLGY